jgi:hypothetical protein
MRRRVALLVLFLCLVFPPECVFAVDIRIDFDGVAAPGLFINANPLRDEYASLGVRFRGLEANDGGAILNASAANFGVPAYSGQNVLGFNSLATMANGGVPRQPEFILFDDLWMTVTIYGSSTSGLDHFIIRAYDGSGAMVVEEQEYSQRQWIPLSVTWAQGIKKVEVTRLENGSPSFVLDSLELTGRVVPEPATMLLLGLGVISLGILRRRN